MIEGHATGRYIRTSAQKAKLVMDLIRGRDVNQALGTLKFARKSIAHDIEKVLRSAIANASNKDGFGGDVDRLYVSACYANQGPSMKRIRPAPMGRAFRVVKRTAHLTVRVEERPAKVLATPARRAPARAKTPARAGAPKASAQRGSAKSASDAPPSGKSRAKKKTSADAKGAGTSE